MGNLALQCCAAAFGFRFPARTLLLATGLGISLTTSTALALTANFDDLSMDDPFVATLTDGGIQFSNALAEGNAGVFGIQDFSTDPGLLEGKPGISPPNLLSIDSKGGNGFRAFHSFDFAAADGSLATSAGLTALDSGGTPGDFLTLEGFLGNVEVASTSVTLTSELAGAYSLALPAGQYDRFSLVASGPVNSGEPLTDFDGVYINLATAPEPSIWALLALGAVGLLGAVRWRSRQRAA